MDPMVKLDISGFGISHVGCVRQRNEDSIHIDPSGRFALLADGMGGHRGGQEASRMTIAAVRHALDSTHSSLSDATEETIRSFLRSTFQSTSKRVNEAGNRDPHLAHMGTTLVCWVRIGNLIYLAHAGDSRAYLLRDNSLFQMTMDHTFVNEQVNLRIPRSQISNLGMRNAIFRNVGMSPPSEPSCLVMESKPNDIWLLCSDGLSGKLTQDQIQEFLSEKKDNSSENSLPELCQKLVETACLAGGEDNVSVVLLKVHT